jgi:hypothetical protein
MMRIIPDTELDAAITAARWFHGTAVNRLIEQYAGAQPASAVPQERRLDLLRDLEALAK